MIHDNIVIFKGKKDGLVIALDKDANFDDLVETLSVKVKSAGKFFGGAKMSIVFEGRTLSEAEETQLLDIIIEEANLNVSFVKESIPNPEQPKPEQKSRRSLGLAFNPHEHMATIHKGALRSGKSIRYAGSVMVLGDANPGSEIVAEGSIVVLGTVKGMVHAGCMGNTGAFVAALSLLPVQLRIAGLATYIPDEMIKESKKNKMPSYAYIEEGQIYISPLE
jgi:septum site-determining protein MinC